MKATTAKMLLEVIRNAKGMLTSLERWVRQEGHIGSVSISQAGSSGAEAETSPNARIEGVSNGESPPSQVATPRSS